MSFTNYSYLCRKDKCSQGLKTSESSMKEESTRMSHQQNGMKNMEKGKKRAIVVGASSGIGLEVTRILMAEGWTVGVAARRIERLQGLGASAVEHIDVTAADAPEGLQRLINKLGGMDLFFYASGIGKQNRELTAEIELAIVSGAAAVVGRYVKYITMIE